MGPDQTINSGGVSLVTFVANKSSQVDPQILREILESAVEIADSDFGTIQLFNPETGDLRIAAHHGLSQQWFDDWSTVSPKRSLCVIALERRERVVVENVEKSPLFVGTPGLDICRKAGIHGMQSTPIISRAGEVLGAFSTHYRKPVCFDQRTLRLLDLLASYAADAVKLSQDAFLRKKADERFRAFFESSAFGAAQIDSTGKFFRVNARYSEITGYSAEELEGHMSPLDLDHPDDIEVDKKYIAGYLAGDVDVYDREKRYIHKDGRVVWVRVRVAPVRSEQGLTEATAAIIEEVTEKRELAAKLARSENRFRDLFSQSLDGIVITRSNGLIEDANLSMLAKCGYSIDELRSLNFIDLIAREDRSQALEELAEFYNTPAIAKIWTLSRKDGSHLTAEVRGRQIKDGGFVYHIRDVTARVIAERQLQQFKNLVQSSSQLIGTCDLDQNITFINAAGLKLVGLKTLEEARNLKIRELHYPPDWSVFQSTFLSTLLATGQAEGETRFRNVQTGEPIWILQTASAMKDQQGKTTGYCTVAIDITERKAIENQLASAQSRLRDAQEVASVGSFEYLAATGETIWSAEEYRIYGLDPTGPSPSYEKLIQTLIHPAEAELLNATFMSAMQEHSTFEMEHRIVRPNGEVRWVQDIARPYFDDEGNLSRYIGATLDITQRKKSELALTESEERLRLALSAGQMGVWDLDVKSGKLLWNDELYKIYGYDPHSVDLSHEVWRDRIHQDDIEQVDEAIRLSIESGQKLRQQYRISRVDGAIRWLESVGNIELDKDKSPSRVYGVVVDITDRKIREEKAALLLREVNHRAKNILAVVKSIAQLTAHESNPKSFLKAFSDRLSALAISHDLLVEAEWDHLSLSNLIKSQTRHFTRVNATRIILVGPEVRISPSEAQALGMAIHELSTNAAKYGALSTKQGRVTIQWNVQSENLSEKSRLIMTWAEEGGPAVVKPSRRGLGYSVIVEMPQHLLDANVTLSFLPKGVFWRLKCELGKHDRDRA